MVLLRHRPRGADERISPVLVAVAIAAFGAESAAQRSRPPAPEPFAWTADRRLTWSDYLGPADITHGAAALTVYAMSISSGCNGDFFSFGVTSMFQPQRSWVKPVMLFRTVDGDRLLHHEQTHFNLSEVHARKLRKALGEVSDPCTRPATESTRSCGKPSSRTRPFRRATIATLSSALMSVSKDAGTTTSPNSSRRSLRSCTEQLKLTTHNEQVNPPEWSARSLDRATARESEDPRLHYDLFVRCQLLVVSCGTCCARSSSCPPTGPIDSTKPSRQARMR